MKRLLAAIIIYGIWSGLASLGVYYLFGVAAQIIFIPCIIIGGVVIGWAVAAPRYD